MMGREISSEKYERRGEHDFSRLKEGISTIFYKLDKKDTIRGDTLFGLTIDILNRSSKVFREIQLRSRDKVIKSVFFGICPEIESIISIPLWIQHSRSSDESYIKIHDYLSLPTEEKQDKIISIKGKYSLKPPNKINIFHGLCELKDRPSYTYDWELVPFLKVNAETFFPYSSPIIFEEIYLPDSSGDYHSAKVNVKSTVGIIKEKYGKEFNIKLPSFRENHPRYLDNIEFESIVKTSPIDFQKKDLVSLLILERYHKDKFEYSILKIRKIDERDIAIHLLISELYHMFLSTGRLAICSEGELESLFNDACVKTRGFLKNNVTFGSLFSYKTVFSIYLKSYFRFIQGNIYYIPKVFHNYSDKEVLLINETLRLIEQYGHAPTLWGSNNATFITGLFQMQVQNYG
ncbi:hypothetical protein ACFLRC_02340 [Candidatus Altiarchaeota archaeon]